ncbi:MAG: alpha/beta fold hydrolase [Legionella sp.]|uniref:alpha/beta hydrolase n=1 Tax=Legionella sp. TaxID=459 RepID=UPI0039E596AB
MFESSYRYMLKKAKERFKETSYTFEHKTLINILHSAVEAAIKTYQKGSISENRKKDIEVIGLIFNNCDRVDQCRKKLDLYFSGKSVEELFKTEPLSQTDRELVQQLSHHQFKTGFLDGSKLEDYVIATVDSFYEHIVQPLLFDQENEKNVENIKKSLHQCLLNAKYQIQSTKTSKERINTSFDKIEAQINEITVQNLNEILSNFAKEKSAKNSLESLFKNNIKPILDKNVRFNEEYSEKSIQYNLNDFINFHIEKYRKEKGNKQGKEYMDDEHIIDSLKMKSDFSQMSPSPLLKKHIVNAFQEFQRYIAKFSDQRLVKIKTWEKQQKPSPQPPKIIIALHGWRDSVECWNNLGQSAIEKGYKVIAYDHRGYGFDDERRNLGHNNDYLTIDFRKFVQSVITENPEAEINLVGHSMGGAILLNNQDFIATQPAIKSVTCFSPAVTPSLSSFFSELRNALFGREAHEEALARQQNNQPRFVANLSKIITTLPYLLSLMTQAYQSLKSLVTKQFAKDTAPSWTIFYGKRDKAVPFSSFEEAQANKHNDKVSFVPLSRGDHLLTQGRHATVAIDAFFEAIETQQKASSKNDLDNISTYGPSLK